MRNLVNKIKRLLFPNYIPAGLYEASEYFRLNGPIHFEFHQEDTEVVAVSDNFRHGSIITAGRNPKELEHNITDAILTAFEIPAAYADHINIKPVGQQQEYAIAL